MSTVAKYAKFIWAGLMALAAFLLYAYGIDIGPVLTALGAALAAAGVLIIPNKQ